MNPSACKDSVRREGFAGFLAIVATGIVLLVRYTLAGVLKNEAPLLLFVLPVVLAARIGGLRPGLFATCLACGAGSYYFFERTGLQIHRPVDQMRIALFLAIGTIISWASECFHRQLAARQILDESLRESEGRYRVLTEVSPQTVWAGRADGYITYCNKHWFDYSGLTMQQSEGNGWTQAIHPDERQRVFSAWFEAQQNGTDYEVEIPFRRASDGIYRWHLAKGRPIKDASGRVVEWIGVAIDIHDHRQVQELEDCRRRLEEANGRLEVLASTDGLTRLKNRRAFQERLTQEVDRAARYDTPLSLLMLDVDRFKQFNDAFGHPTGDGVLRAVAHLLEETARCADLVARYGGEEFAVLLPDTDEQGALALADRFRRAVMERDWQESPITVSVGVATLQPGNTGAMLLEQADAALYCSKRSGRNCVRHASRLGASMPVIYAAAHEIVGA